MQNMTVNPEPISALPFASSDLRDTAVDHQIRTLRLYMRPVNESDLNDFIAIFSDPAVVGFIGIEAGAIPGAQEIEQLLNGAVNAWVTRGYGRWSMFDCKTDEFIGFCGFRSELGVPELICMLHERFWGQGIAAEAATACIDYGCQSLGFTTVKAYTRPAHSRARRVLEKLDAEFTGYTNFHGVSGASYTLVQKSTDF